MKTLALVLLIATPLWGLTFENYSFIDNITATTDGGYVVSGSQSGNGSWIAKYMPGEGIEWGLTGISVKTLAPADNDGCLIVHAPSSISELDADGHLLWSLYLDYHIKAASKSNDGWIVIGGNRKIKKILPGGIIEWSQEVEGQGNYGNSDLTDVAATPDGGCLVVGSYATYDDSLYIAYDAPCVARLNSEGEVLWWRFYDLDGWGGGATNVARGADGTWGVSGYMYQLEPEPECGDPACFAHIDDEGNLLNVKTYKRLLVDYIGGIESNGDDGWVFAGGYLSLISRAICDHTFEFSPWGAYYINAALIEIDYDGEVINSLTSKNTNGYMSVNGLIHAHDGRWLLYGSIHPNNSVDIQAWIDWFSFD